MKRIEPNLLLALSTAIALALLIMSASLFGAPGRALKYGLLVLVCAPLFVALNGWWKARSGRPRLAMIHPGAPGVAGWAALFPALLFLAAAIPLLFPGHDYGLLIVIAAVWFGGTAESALIAHRPR